MQAANWRSNARLFTLQNSASGECRVGNSGLQARYSEQTIPTADDNILGLIAQLARIAHILPD